MKHAIEIQELTKDYGNGRGVFGLNLNIEPGEMFGFVGTNGAGKTTTIRHMMGFLRQDSGSVRVRDMDAWAQASEIKRYVGYVPGKSRFPICRTELSFCAHRQSCLASKICVMPTS